MRVTVHVFARLRELAGREQWSHDLPDGSTVGELWREVIASHPPMRDFTTAVSSAVNADFSSMDAELHEGDDVAFLPPVSGGFD